MREEEVGMEGKPRGMMKRPARTGIMGREVKGERDEEAK